VLANQCMLRYVLHPATKVRKGVDKIQETSRGYGGEIFCRCFNFPSFLSFYCLLLLYTAKYSKIGRVRHKWNTPKKSRFFGLVKHDMLKPQAAKELGLSKSTTLKWTSDRRSRPLSQQLKRSRVITNEHINQIVL